MEERAKVSIVKAASSEPVEEEAVRPVEPLGRDAADPSAGRGEASQQRIQHADDGGVGAVDVGRDQ